MISAEMLKGKKVIGIKGVLIGEIDGTEINVDNWKVTNVRIHLTDDIAKQLGYKTSLISMSKPVISLPVEVIDQIGDVVTLKSEIKEVQDLELAKIKMTQTA